MTLKPKYLTVCEAITRLAFGKAMTLDEYGKFVEGELGSVRAEAEKLYYTQKTVVALFPTRSLFGAS